MLRPTAGQSTAIPQSAGTVGRARRTQGDLEKCLPWHFSRRKDENVVFAFLHFQSLGVIENGGASLRRAGTPIIRGALKIRADFLLRLRYNPFHDYLDQRVLDWTKP
jgi:hypothetical protein